MHTRHKTESYILFVTDECYSLVLGEIYTCAGKTDVPKTYIIYLPVLPCLPKSKLALNRNEDGAKCVDIVLFPI